LSIDAAPSILHFRRTRQESLREVAVAPHAADDLVERHVLQTHIALFAQPQPRANILEAQQLRRFSSYQSHDFVPECAHSRALESIHAGEIVDISDVVVRHPCPSRNSLASSY